MKSVCSNLEFYKDYSIIPFRGQSVVDLNESGKVEKDKDLTVFAKIVDEKSGKTTFEPVGYDTLKKAIKDIGGMATCNNLVRHSLGAIYEKKGKNLVNITLGSNHISALGCNFSLSKNDISLTKIFDIVLKSDQN